jgi:hypothetical protein
VLRARSGAELQSAEMADARRPQVTERGPASAAIEPAPTEPASTEPAPNEPGPIEPGPIEPRPIEPAPP